LGSPGDRKNGSFFAQGDAIIRRYYQVNPETLSDNAWAKYIAEWQFTEQYEKDKTDANIKAIRGVLVEMVNAIFPKKK
jgi:hypothetical protein